MTLFIIINQNPLFAKANPFQICQLIVESRLEFKMDEIFAKVRVLMKMSSYLKSERGKSNNKMSICCKLCQTRKLKKNGKYLKRSDSLEKLLEKLLFWHCKRFKKIVSSEEALFNCNKSQYLWNYIYPFFFYSNIP